MYTNPYIPKLNLSVLSLSAASFSFLSLTLDWPPQQHARMNPVKYITKASTNCTPSGIIINHKRLSLSFKAPINKEKNIYVLC